MIEQEGIMGRYEEIQQLAYQIWEEEGWINGQELEHWTRAEQIWESRQTLQDVKLNKKPAAKKARKSKEKNTN